MGMFDDLIEEQQRQAGGPQPQQPPPPPPPPPGMFDDLIEQAKAAKPPPTGERVDQPFTWGGAAKQAGVGVAKGVIGALGMGGDLADFVGRKTEEYAPGYGATGRRIAGAVASPGLALFTGGQVEPPSSGSIQKKVEGVTGEFRKPQNTAEDYAQTAGEFAPNVVMPTRAGVSLLSSAIRRGANVLAPAAASETAGQFYKGTDVEPWARAAGGIAAPFAASAAGRLITPNPATPAHRALADTVRQHGVPMTAGDATGNRALRITESQAADMPFSGGRATVAVGQRGEDLGRAVARFAGENLPAGQGPTPPVIDAMFTRLGTRFDTLARRNAMDIDGALGADLATHYGNYLNVTAPSMRVPIIDRIVREIRERHAAAPGSPLSGEAYNTYTSQLAAAARATADPAAQRTIYQMRHALDDAMERSMARNGSPDAGAFRDVRGQYRNALILEHAMLAKLSDLGLGQMSPAALGTAARQVGGRRNYVRGRGDIDELATAAESVFKPLPQSGTAGRSLIQTAISGGLGMAGGAGVAGIPGALAGAALGVAAPATVGRVVNSRAAQAYLGNQLLGGEARPSPSRRALINALLSRNEDEREPTRITVKRPRQ